LDCDNGSLLQREILGEDQAEQLDLAYYIDNYDIYRDSNLSFGNKEFLRFLIFGTEVEVPQKKLV